MGEQTTLTVGKGTREELGWREKEAIACEVLDARYSINLKKRELPLYVENPRGIVAPKGRYFDKYNFDGYAVSAEGREYLVEVTSGNFTKPDNSQDPLARAHLKMSLLASAQKNNPKLITILVLTEAPTFELWKGSGVAYMARQHGVRVVLIDAYERKIVEGT